MKNNITSFLVSVLIIMVSCEKECLCDSVVYESTFETNYEWMETSRSPSEGCSIDTLSSSFLDNNGNISYVRTIIECDS